MEQGLTRQQHTLSDNFHFHQLYEIPYALCTRGRHKRHNQPSRARLRPTHASHEIFELIVTQIGVARRVRWIAQQGPRFPKFLRPRGSAFDEGQLPRRIAQPKPCTEAAPTISTRRPFRATGHLRGSPPPAVALVPGPAAAAYHDVAPISLSLPGGPCPIITQFQRQRLSGASEAAASKPPAANSPTLTNTGPPTSVDVQISLKTFVPFLEHLGRCQELGRSIEDPPWNRHLGTGVHSRCHRQSRTCLKEPLHRYPRAECAPSLEHRRPDYAAFRSPSLPDNDPHSAPGSVLRGGRRLDRGSSPEQGVGHRH